MPALSLNCVMRFIQPMRATQLKIQASSACCGTWDWLKTILFLRIDAGGEEGGGDRADLGGHVLVDQLGRQRMHVDDAVDAVVVFLQGDELSDGAEIVAEMEVPVGCTPEKTAA